MPKPWKLILLPEFGADPAVVAVAGGVGAALEGRVLDGELPGGRAGATREGAAGAGVEGPLLLRRRTGVDVPESDSLAEEGDLGLDDPEWDSFILIYQEKMLTV